jgi:peroxiredoxin Q/BCP
MTKFERAGIQPFGVNPADVAAHQKYAAKFKFPFPLLSDPERAAARAFHAVKDDGKGIQRTVYVVGKNGTILFAQRGMPEVDDIVASVERGG